MRKRQTQCARKKNNRRIRENEKENGQGRGERKNKGESGRGSYGRLGKEGG